MSARLRNRLLTVGVALGGLSLVLPGVASAAVSPVDLGTLPGDQYSSVTAINDSGTMIGVSYPLDAQLRYHPAKWDRQGRISALPALGGERGEPRAITTRDVVVGSAQTADSVWKPVLWSASGAVTALPLLWGGTSGDASAISETGIVAGSSTSAGGKVHAVRWSSDGRVTDLGVLPGGGSSFATGISRDGRVISGTATDAEGNRHVVRWVAGGAITDLTPGIEDADAKAINAAGEIVGQVRLGAWDVAVKWDRAGKLIRLDWQAPPPTSSYATAINDAGIAVGAGYPDFDGTVATRWDRHGALTVLPSDTRGAEASAINGSGVVAGSADRQAAKWDSTGARTALDSLPGGDYSAATVINASGRTAGLSATADGRWHAVYWPAG